MSILLKTQRNFKVREVKWPKYIKVSNLISMQTIVCAEHLADK